MLTDGGATSGYCATGSARIDATPASMMTIEIPHANTGRLAKTLASMSVARARPRRPAARLVRVRRRAREHLVRAFDDHLIADGEAALDEPAVADRARRDQRAGLDLAVLADHQRGRVALRVV